MMGSSGSGPAMAFVHMKKHMTREQVEELVVKWRDLLFTAGFVRPTLSPIAFVVKPKNVNRTSNRTW